ncbi:MAG: nucleoside recognition protein [Methanomicrobiaceae archaeon]|nr:nucleoside recognition protein [Methanomicrobiaceae archaeon]
MEGELFVDAALLAGGLLLRSVPVMAAGVLLAELLVALRITDRIASLVLPITRFSHLSHGCGACFLMAFISASAANAMLADHYHHGRIVRRELVIASLLNSFPAIVMHWRILLPVYIPLLGLAGALYFLILTAVGLVKTVIVMFAGRVFLPKPDDTFRIPEAKPRPEMRDLIGNVWQSAKKPLTRILAVTVPTIIIVAVLIEAGLFECLAESLSGVSGLFPVPVEGVGIIAAQFAHYVAAAGVASPLYASGIMSTRDLVLTMLVGNVLSSVTRTARWFGPAYVGIFGPRIGTEVMLYSTLLRNGIMLIVIFALALFWL